MPTPGNIDDVIVAYVRARSEVKELRGDRLALMHRLRETDARCTVATERLEVLRNEVIAAIRGGATHLSVDFRDADTPAPEGFNVDEVIR